MEDYPIGSNVYCCDKCKYYYMIDSGYGWCVRFPPKNIQIRKFLKITFAFTYPEVPWDCAKCGEFKNR
jgi:hypothetical protein